jgi:hypothetical protein
MAKHLIQDIGFCHYVSVAPEGHIYGYFFSRIGAHPIAVSVDYPPTKVTAQADVSQICGGTVLIIEDDVVGGGTLRLVVQEVLKFKLRSVSLFLGHSRSFRHLESIPREIEKVYIAEDILSRDEYLKRADELYEEFQKGLL